MEQIKTIPTRRVIFKGMSDEVMCNTKLHPDPDTYLYEGEARCLYIKTAEECSSNGNVFYTFYRIFLHDIDCYRRKSYISRVYSNSEDYHKATCLTYNLDTVKFYADMAIVNCDRGHLKEDSLSFDGILFYSRGVEIARFGTEDFDDYYPQTVAHMDIEVINEHIQKGKQ